MPEGDTIFKLAAYLKPALQGRRLVAGQVHDPQPKDLANCRIVDVYARGKHLFIELDDDRLLRSHLGMWGSWHGYAPGEAWQRPDRQASIVLDVGDRIYVCFNPLQVELLRKRGVRARRLGLVLGPDLMGQAIDYAEVIARARSLCDSAMPIADVLLDQRVACGIGNVFKSEVLFVERCHPATALGDLGDDRLNAIYRHASRLLGQNRRGGPRVTRHANDEAGRLWVYGRTGQPCLACDAPICSLLFGRAQRSTFWCPRCQPPPGGAVDRRRG